MREKEKSIRSYPLNRMHSYPGQVWNGTASSAPRGRRYICLPLILGPCTIPVARSPGIKVADKTCMFLTELKVGSSLDLEDIGKGVLAAEAKG